MSFSTFALLANLSAVFAMACRCYSEPESAELISLDSSSCFDPWIEWLGNVEGMLTLCRWKALLICRQTIKKLSHMSPVGCCSSEGTVVRRNSWITWWIVQVREQRYRVYARGLLGGTGGKINLHSFKEQTQQAKQGWTERTTAVPAKCTPPYCFPRGSEICYTPLQALLRCASDWQNTSSHLERANTTGKQSWSKRTTTVSAKHTLPYWFPRGVEICYSPSRALL